MAYESIVGPIGVERGDWQAAVGAWASTLPHAPKGKTIAVEDYLLDFDNKEPEELTEEDMADRERMLLESFKAAVGDKGTWQ